MGPSRRIRLIVTQGEELSLALLVETDRVHQAELSLVPDDGHVPSDAHERVHSNAAADHEEVRSDLLDGIVGVGRRVGHWWDPRIRWTQGSPRGLSGAPEPAVGWTPAEG